MLYVTSFNPEAVLLVTLGTSSFPVRKQVYRKTTEKFVPSWEPVRTHTDLKYDLRVIVCLARHLERELHKSESIRKAI